MLRSSAAIPMMGDPRAGHTGARPTHATNDRLMLRGLRTASSGWLGKTIMAGVVGFLVINFALLGIRDIFRGFRRRPVASVVSTPDSIQQIPPRFTHSLPAPRRHLPRPV